MTAVYAQVYLMVGEPAWSPAQTGVYSPVKRRRRVLYFSSIRWRCRVCAASVVTTDLEE